MSAPDIIYVCRWLIRDTFRQALANRVLWVLLGACAVVILFCLSISVEHGEVKPPDDIEVDRPSGHMFLAFGAWRLPMGTDGPDTAHLILLVLGEGVFGVVGTLLALVLTAGFVPDFLQRSNATVFLSKPTPRWVMVLGKYLGVLTLLACYAGVYVVGTWLAVGLRTGFWVNNYLWGMPLLLLQVAAVYSFSAFLGVCTGSNLVSVFGSVLFWLMCWGMNYGRHLQVVLESDLPDQSVVFRGLVEAGYWILPKPVDLGMILHAAMQSGQADPNLQKIVELGAFHPLLSVLTSVVFVVAMIALAAQQLASKDY
jgi:ABC-type transport system involved in multi-copper enzyme maturation permease subunit